MTISSKLKKQADFRRLPSVAAALSRDAEHCRHLLFNRMLPEQVVTDLLTDRLTGAGKLPAEDQANLVRRTLTDEQALLAATKLRSTTAIKALIHANALTIEAQRALATAGKHVKGALLDDLVHVGFAPELIAELMFERGKGFSKLAWASTAPPDLLSDEQVAELLTTLDAWMPRGKRGMGEYVRLLLERGPQVIEAAIGSNSSAVRAVVAGSRHLDERQARHLAGIERDDAGTLVLRDGFDLAASSFVLVALVWNPVTPQQVLDDLAEAYEPGGPLHNASMDAKSALNSRLRSKPAPVTEPFDQVTDAKQLDWIVRRAHTRPCDAPVVLANEHLDEQQRRLILDAAARADEPWVDYVDEHLGEQFAEAGIERNPAQDTSTDGRTRLSYRASQPEDIPVEAAREAYERLADDEVGRWTYVYNDWVLVGLADVLGDDVARWMTFLTMVDEWDGTVRELVELVDVLASDPAAA